jgi:hypothetical protein
MSALLHPTHMSAWHAAFLLLFAAGCVAVCYWTGEAIHQAWRATRWPKAPPGRWS